jgi:dipeptidyl aminopeptidase/acylaminoacyl peptidase
LIPTLWLLGGQERLVPTRECVAVLDTLRSSGRGVEFVVYPDEGHGLFGADYWPAIDAFLGRHGLR